MYRRTIKESKRAISLLNKNVIMASNWGDGYSSWEIPHYCFKLNRDEFTEKVLNSLDENIQLLIEKMLDNTKARKIIFITDLDEAKICAEVESERNLQKYINAIKKDKRVFLRNGFIYGVQSTKLVEDTFLTKEKNILVKILNEL